MRSNTNNPDWPIGFVDFVYEWNNREFDVRATVFEDEVFVNADLIGVHVPGGPVEHWARYTIRLSEVYIGPAEALTLKQLEMGIMQRLLSLADQ
jgi:hypothetical protein